MAGVGAPCGPRDRHREQLAAERLVQHVDEAGAAVRHRRQVELVVRRGRAPAGGDGLRRLDRGEGAGELVRRHQDPHAQAPVEVSGGPVADLGAVRGLGHRVEAPPLARCLGAVDGDHEEAVAVGVGPVQVGERLDQVVDDRPRLDVLGPALLVGEVLRGDRRGRPLVGDDAVRRTGGRRRPRRARRR